MTANWNTVKPFARSANGNISIVYDVISGEYARPYAALYRSTNVIIQRQRHFSIRTYIYHSLHVHMNATTESPAALFPWRAYWLVQIV